MLQVRIYIILFIIIMNQKIKLLNLLLNTILECLPEQHRMAFFSGVSFGVNSNSDNIIKKTNRKYFYDPDYEWVNGVIKRLEGNWDILPKLK